MSWRSGAPEEEGAGVAVDQGPVPTGGSEEVLVGKRQREELVGQPGRHSLWEQGPLGTGFYARQDRTGREGTCPWWSVVAGLEGAGDVPPCPAPTRGLGGNKEGQAGGKVGGTAPEDGAEDSAEVEGAVTARHQRMH